MGKYSKLFKVDDGDVNVKENIANAVNTLESTRKVIDDAPRISATITITNADIKTVQRFLWNLTENAMINNFEFNNSAATVQTKGSIRVNEFDSNIYILKQSFKLLMAEGNKNTDALAFYALGCIPEHLDRIRDHAGWSDMQATDKSDIGKFLYAILESGDIIERHWTSFNLEQNSAYFFYSSSWFSRTNEPSPFWRWLDDPDAIKNLGHKDKDWLAKLKSEPNANQALLRDVTLMVAKRWARDREWAVSGTFQWIHKFLCMVRLLPCTLTQPFTYRKQKQPSVADKPEDTTNVEVVDDIDAEHHIGTEAGETATTEQVEEEDNDDSSDAASEAPSGDNSITSKDIADAATWVQEALNIQTLDSLWFERLGETYMQLCYDNVSAIKAFKEAITLDNPSWQCL
jgi:hypothetical protein